MSPSPQLAPPGSSSYSSDTMHVGDGTWDASRNNFLLPNLQGLNFDTMRYNGMGNRFASLSGYHSLIRGHGVIAFITFLGIVPAAIVTARFYHRNPRLALRLHIALQILTLLLTTVIFILSWFAVGIPRSLTNPHHGIGLAIYVLVWFQVIGGAFIHHTEKKKVRHRIPLKLYLHQWLGRAIALLGIAQIPLGLTLYGSPKWTFIVFTLVAFAWLLLYFILSFRNRLYLGGDDAATYISGTRSGVVEDRREHRHRGLKTLATAGAAGAGIAALRRRSRSRRREHEEGGNDVISSRHSSPRRHSESLIDEKYDVEHDGKQHTWRNRLLGAAGLAGGLAALRSYTNRRKDRDRESDVGSYSQPYGGPQPVSQTDVSRIEEGRPPDSPANDRTRRHGHHNSAQYHMTSPVRPPDPGRLPSQESFGTYSSPSDYGLREGIGALGVGGFLTHKWNRYRRRKEDRRVSQVKQHDRSYERLARLNSQRHRPGQQQQQQQQPHPVGHGYARRNSLTSSVGLTGSNPELSRHTLPRPGLASVPTGPMPPLDHRTGGVVDEGYRPGTGVPPPPNTVAVAPSLVPGAGAPAGQPRNHHGRGSSATSNAGSVASPPVSVKVKMHTDGRHVTLRRLNEAEAQAEREARRRERRQHRNGGRRGSLSSVGSEAGDRWRRVEEREAREARETGRGAGQGQMGQGGAGVVGGLPGPPPGAPPVPAHSSPFVGALPGAQVVGVHDGGAGGVDVHLPPPPPPPIPAATPSAMTGSPVGAGMGASPLGGGLSMGSPYETGTDVSKADTNRRRRRAERAQAKARGQGGGQGNRVEFT